MTCDISQLSFRSTPVSREFHASSRTIPATPRPDRMPIPNAILKERARTQTHIGREGKMA